MNEALENYLIDARWNPEVETEVPLHECLYHYTSADSFLNIVQPEGILLWASQIDCMNDKMEWLHAAEIYRAVCNQLLKAGEISENFYQAVSHIKPSSKQLFLQKTGENIISAHQEKSSRFICCFSKEQDSLPMWNYYSKSNARSGYNIGFFNAEIITSKRTHTDPYVYHTYRVIYDDSTKFNIIRKRIKELGDLVHTKEELEIVADEISYFLLEWAITFKCSDFAYENEVRLLVDVPLSEAEKQVKYRTNNGLIVPYIEVRFPHDILSYVKIGPLSCLPDDNELQREIVKKMLSSRGYRNIDVSSSKVPIRF